MGGGGKGPPPRTPEETAKVPLSLDLLVDVGSGLTAGLCAAPFIMTVDRAVTEVASGASATMSSALRRGLVELATRPHALLRSTPFWMVAGVYGSTYVAANSIDSILERALDPHAASTPFAHGAVKLVGVTAVNMSAGIAKDAAFARMFGAAGAAAAPPVPRLTLAIFALRDLLTIGAAFTVPAFLSQALVGARAMEPASADEAAQLLSPIGMQCVCTPIHLFALSAYNMPGARAAEHARSVGGLLPGALGARMARFGAAYGASGLLNTTLLHRGRDWALQRALESAPEPTPEQQQLERTRTQSLYRAPNGERGDPELEPRDPTVRRGTLRRHATSHFGYYPNLTRRLTAEAEGPTPTRG